MVRIQIETMIKNNIKGRNGRKEKMGEQRHLGYRPQAQWVIWWVSDKIISTSSQRRMGKEPHQSYQHLNDGGGEVIKYRHILAHGSISGH